MTPELENFENLQRLLRLKRHEQPPPGYFANFSAKVIARIEAQGEAAQLSWWRRLLLGMDVKPALVCAYSLSVAGLLVVGLTLASSDDGTTANLPPAPTLLAHPVTATPVPLNGASQPQLTVQAMPMGESSSSVDPVLNPDAAPPGFFSPDGNAGLFGNPEPLRANKNFLLDTR